MKIINIFFSSFKKYGFKLLTNIFIFEILNLYRFRLADYFAEDPTLKKYEPYIPSPYYILSLLKEFFYSANSVFIDFGCGKGRVIKFINSYNNFKEIVGIENNLKLKKDLKKIKSNKINIYFKDCNNKKFIKYLSKKHKNKKTILYFYHPFSELMINDIINIFLKQHKNNLKVILVGKIKINRKIKSNFELNKLKVNPMLTVYNFKYH